MMILGPVPSSLYCRHQSSQNKCYINCQANGWGRRPALVVRKTITVSTYTPDTNSPSLLDFNLDMDDGIISKY